MSYASPATLKAYLYILNKPGDFQLFNVKPFNFELKATLIFKEFFNPQCSLAKLYISVLCILS